MRRSQILACLWLMAVAASIEAQQLAERLNEIQQRIDDRLNDFQTQIDNTQSILNQRLTTMEQLLDQRLDRFQTTVDTNAAKHDAQVESLESSVTQLGEALYTNTRQLMMHQFQTGEALRNSGGSGVKVVRVDNIGGSHPFDVASHAHNSFMSIHDHADNIRTLGSGEFGAVMNGVEFRTRHNDYPLKMKVTDNKNFLEVEDIPFPDVPDEVLALGTVDDQINEMKEWFKAWRDENYSPRDYRKHFKPVLCYLEAGWMIADQNGFDEPFESDRHSVDATSWLDLHQKVMFASHAGKKDTDENFAVLPTTIIGMSGSDPVEAQWNYRILCHPLKEYLPVSSLYLVDDLRTRMAFNDTMDEYAARRAARFQVTRDRNAIAKLMNEIPGLDNYGAELVDDSLGETAYPVDGNVNSDPLNVALYSNAYSGRKGAMGTTKVRRGFSDPSLYVAQNTQSRIPAVNVTRCRPDNPNRCQTWSKKFSYAIPLEIVYLTPLSKWNPYDIEYKGESGTHAGDAIFSSEDTDGTPEKPFAGTNSKVYYQTPTEFFKPIQNSDPADTTKDAINILDKGGNRRVVSASGIRSILPEIDGVGTFRQRFPTAPVHGEGSSVWKELSALEESIRFAKEYDFIFGTGSSSCSGSGSQQPTSFTFRTTRSDVDYGFHTHPFTVSVADLKAARDNEEPLEIETEYGSASHTHTLRIRCSNTGPITLRSCDGALRQCWDGHDGVEIDDNSNHQLDCDTLLAALSAA